MMFFIERSINSYSGKEEVKYLNCIDESTWKNNPFDEYDYIVEVDKNKKIIKRKKIPKNSLLKEPQGIVQYYDYNERKLCYDFLY